MIRRTTRRILAAGTVTAAATAAALSVAGTASAGTGAQVQPGAVQVSAIHRIDGESVGPFGYKGLSLGMTEQQAVRTGLITGREAIGSCTWYYLKSTEGQSNPGDGVVISPARGVVNIPGTDTTHTPEGISMGSIDDHAGSTAAQIAAAYPDRTTDPDQPITVYNAPTPGNADAHYVFAMGEDGRVKDLALTSNADGGCFN